MISVILSKQFNNLIQFKTIRSFFLVCNAFMYTIECCYSYFELLKTK